MPVFLDSIRELGTLRDKIVDSINDERSAVSMYDEMARMADQVGMPGYAATIRQIRDQENVHYRIFSEMKAAVDREARRRGAHVR